MGGFLKNFVEKTRSLQNASSLQKTKAARKSGGSLWYHLELNQGHTDFQSVALPTELWYLFAR